jgi:putative transposase
VVGIFPNDVVRLIAAILVGQNDVWVVQRVSCMTPATMAPLSDDPTISLPTIAS